MSRICVVINDLFRLLVSGAYVRTDDGPPKDVDLTEQIFGDNRQSALVEAFRQYGCIEFKFYHGGAHHWISNSYNEEALYNPVPLGQFYDEVWNLIGDITEITEEVAKINELPVHVVSVTNNCGLLYVDREQLTDEDLSAFMEYARSLHRDGRIKCTPIKYRMVDVTQLKLRTIFRCN